MKEEGKELESRGLWHYERIGRPRVMYDQRSKYHSNLDEFNSSMNERKKIGRSTVIVELNSSKFEEEL